MKVFVDTDVLVSAVATRGLCADVLREILAAHELVVSRQVLDETRRILRAKLGVGPELVAEVVGLLERDSSIAVPVRLPRLKLKDRDDVPIVGAAVASGAELLVTGDRELLELGTVGRMRIVSPRGFWETLKSNRPRPKPR